MTPETLASILVTLITTFGGCFVAWLRARARERLAVRQLGLCTQCSSAIQPSKPPPPITGAGPLLLLILGGLLGLLLARPEVLQLARKGGGPVHKSCTTDQNCGKGQRCENGTCVATAKRLIATDFQAIGEGTWCADRIVPSWQDTLPETFPDRPPEL